jgi:hypothetical protein
VVKIAVKESNPESNWVWGALRMPAATMRQLYELWRFRHNSDQYLGTLLNAHIARGGRVLGVRRGETYVDVGTLHGYREAIRILSERQGSPAAAGRAASLDLRPRLYGAGRRGLARA